jgi:selenocysteine-specific elongation factor
LWLFGVSIAALFFNLIPIRLNSLQYSLSSRVVAAGRVHRCAIFHLFSRYAVYFFICCVSFISVPMLPLLNINTGILGHVDSGKTSLVRALSTALSTCALDKHPQSLERGITLDLGFSSFSCPIPEHLAHLRGAYSALQFTLVDCPGHASLIKTVIGGSQIIDSVLLVIDIVKGIQTQTAECLVIAEVTTAHLIVVLNKVDLLPEDGRAKKVDVAVQRIRKALASTRFSDAPIIVLSAVPGGGGKLGAAAPLTADDGSAAAIPLGLKSQSATVAELVALMQQSAFEPAREERGPFLFSVDHCFPIKGQGTVLTGTVLSGRCRIGDTVELPSLRQERKIKSMQMFKRPTDALRQGDRAGICVTNLDASLVERGLLCTPGAGVRLSK